MELDFADVKPTVITLITVFLMVAVTVPLAKYALNRWPVPGLTDLVNTI